MTVPIIIRRFLWQVFLFGGFIQFDGRYIGLAL